MPKSSPEKLAKALRANLKKRKASPGLATGEGCANAPQTPAEPPESGPERVGQAPPRRPTG